MDVANLGGRWFSALVVPALFITVQGCDSPTAIDSAHPPAYSAEERAYFEEISLGSEYASSSDRVVKWAQPIVIRLQGAPSPADVGTLEQVIREINEILGFEKVRLGGPEGNLEVWFAPLADFPRLEPKYVSGNKGFVTLGWDSRGMINRGRVLISTTGLNQRQRDHLVREEVTQALGLLRDSPRYPESIFFGGWSETTEYAPIDRVLIRMLHRDEVQAGMSRSTLRSVLNRLPRKFEEGI